MADPTSEELARSIQELTEALNGLGVTANSGRDKFERSVDAMFKIKGAGKAVVDSFSGAANAATKLTKRLYEGEQGAKILGDAFEEVATAVGGLMLVLGPFGKIGKIAGVALMALGKYANLAAQQSDRLYKSYQDLGKIGMTTTGGLASVAESAYKLGYGLNEIDLQKFNQLMTDSAESLAMLSTSAGAGRKRFADFTTTIVRSDLRRQFMNLGMEVDDINRAAANYVEMEASRGRARGLTDQQLRDGTVRYIENLDTLSRLTGVQAKDMQAQMDANRRQERFQAYLMKVERTQGREARENIEANMAVVARQFPDLAQGLMDIASGIPDTEAAGRAFMSGMGRIPQLMTQRIGGGLQEIGEAAKRTSNRFGETYGRVGIFNETFGNLYEMNKAAGMTMVDYNKAIEAAIKERDELRKGTAKDVDAQTKLRISQMNQRDSLQGLVNLGVAPVTSSFMSLNTALEKLLSFLPGTPKATGGGAGGPRPPTTGGVPGGGEAAGTLGSIRDMIGRAESRGDYNVLVGGKKQDLTNMTLSQVYDLQKTMMQRGSGFESSAVGKYQFTYGTLRSMANKLGMDPATTKFDQATQDRLADELIIQQGYNKYAAGAMSKEKFLRSLSTQWAGLPMDQSGRSFHAGVGTNKATMGYDEAMKSFGTGGISRGPESGYTARLHGTEAVVPLPDGKSIPIDVAGLSRQIKDMILNLSDDRYLNVGGLDTHGGFQAGGLRTFDNNLTKMIMERLGLTDIRSKRLINLSGIGTNMRLGDVDIGSSMGGGFMRGEIANQVAKLVEGGTPLEQALEKTTQEFSRAMQEFVQQRTGPDGRGMQELINQLKEMVELQRQNNSTQSRILQVTTN